MFPRFLTIVTMNVTATLLLALGWSRITTAAEVAQRKDHGEATLDAFHDQFEQQALDLINQRAAALQLTLPPLALRGDPRSRFFAADFPRKPAIRRENQEWRSHLTTADDGVVELNLPTAFDLATLHSDAYQRQVESLHLAAFEVLGLERLKQEGGITTDDVTLARPRLDAEIERFCDFRQQLLTTVTAGCAGENLSDNRTIYPPAPFGTTQLDGYLGLVQQQHWIQLTRDLLADDSRELARLRVHSEHGMISTIKVDACRQLLEQERAQLHSAEVAFQDALDSFKVKLLGLPPALRVRVTPSFGGRLELVDPSAKQLAKRIDRFRRELGELGFQEDAARLQPLLQQVPQLQAEAEAILSTIEQDMQRVNSVKSSSQGEEAKRNIEMFRSAIQASRVEFDRYLSRDTAAIANGLSETSGTSRTSWIESHDRCAHWASGIDRFVTKSTLLQAGLRLELAHLEPVDLNLEQTLCLAKQKDPRWRETRDQLTAWHKTAQPFPFVEDDHAARAGRMVDYQRARRTLMLCEDGIEADLRNTFDTLTGLEESLEIQRHAVAIAIRRVALCLEILNEPRLSMEPGTRPPQFADTAAMDLFTALSDFRTSQHNFVSVWLTHYATRIHLYCDLGLTRSMKTVAGPN